MNLSLPHLLELVRFTLQRPREGARMVMRADLPNRARWVALALTAVCSALLAHVAFSLMPAQTMTEFGGTPPAPFTTALVQAGLMVASVQAVYWIGRWFGGQGRFEDALILMVWLQFILLVLQVLQIVVQVILPPLASVVGMASVGVFLWLLSHFVAELHGFASARTTFFGIMGVFLGLGVILWLFLLPSLI